MAKGLSDVKTDTSAKPWEVLTDEDVTSIAEFGGMSVEQVRGVEMFVLLKSGKATVG